MALRSTQRICPQGHQYVKSSDCPTCPVCVALKKPRSGFLSLLASPARNALLHAGISTLQQLSGYTEKEVLKLHGMGPSSIPVLKGALKKEGLEFQKE